MNKKLVIEMITEFLLDNCWYEYRDHADPKKAAESSAINLLSLLEMTNVIKSDQWTS